MFKASKISTLDDKGKSKGLTVAEKGAHVGIDESVVELKAEILVMRRKLVDKLDEHRKWDSLHWNFKERCKSLTTTCDMGKSGWLGWTKD